jgi:predicted NAD-dependent protein-ADP-ribosyltransferase YbiA (DUF1768 family)
VLILSIDYFQAQKFAGTDYEEEIRNAATPQIAKDKGFSKHHPLRDDWENVKQDVRLNIMKYG